MNREVQAVMLILLGGSTLRISIGDTYLRYVKAGMRPYLLLTGALLLVLGIWALVDLVRTHRNHQPEPVDIGAEQHDGHGHTGMRAAWLLLLPVLAILLVAPPALGAYSAERGPSQVSAPADSAAFDPLPAGDPVEIALNEYAVRAVWSGQDTLVGRKVQMVGFVTPTGSGQWWLTRLSLACCAADAVTTKIVAVGAPDLAANTWVELTGTYVPGGGTDSNTAVPWVQTQQLRRIPEPKNPYE